MLRFIFVLCFSFLFIFPAQAAEEKAGTAPPAVKTDTAKEPDISSVLFMQNLRNIGAKIFYLGEQLGLHGWFVVKDKQVQILYTTPDNKALLVGALLSAEGANISQQQVLNLASNNPEVQAVIKDTNEKTPDVNKPDAAKTDVASVADNKEAAPSEKFYTALQGATGPIFGKETAPLLQMIIDVHCPYCKKTWMGFQKYVEEGKLRVKIIPIEAIDGSINDAARWINKKDMYDAWKKHVEGDKTQLSVGPVDPEKTFAIGKNTSLVKEWGVDQTPYILYRGKSGKVRLVVGMPKDIDAIIQDLAP